MLKERQSSQTSQFKKKKMVNMKSLTRIPRHHYTGNQLKHTSSGLSKKKKKSEFKIQPTKSPRISQDWQDVSSEAKHEINFHKIIQTLFILKADKISNMVFITILSYLRYIRFIL